MKQTGRAYQIGLLSVMAAAVAWSTAGLFTRALSVDTATILFWRGLFGGLGMVAVMLALGALRPLGRAGWAYAGLTALSMLLFISALRSTTVAHVAIITAIVPFVAAWLGWIFGRDVPGRAAVVASLLALTGVAIMVGVRADGSVAGDALAVAMALCMGGDDCVVAQVSGYSGTACHLRGVAAVGPGDAAIRDV